jgi:hypothetical protein
VTGISWQGVDGRNVYFGGDDTTLESLNDIGQTIRDLRSSFQCSDSHYLNGTRMFGEE